jgi:Subtilase family
MRQHRLSILAGLFAVANLLVAGATSGEPPGRAADRILVQLRDVRAAAARGSVSALTIREWSQRLGLPARVVLRSMHPKTGPHSNSKVLLDVTETLPLDRPIVVELNGALSVDAALARLKGRPEVVFAEPDFVGSGGGAPNDPNYPLQWHHPKIQSEGAWSISTGSSGVIVAVLDTGLNLSLSEFAGRLVPGHDYVNNDNNPTDDYGHGTAVTGVIAANANNGVLVAGVNWQCRILPEKVLDSNNLGFYSVWAQAIYDVTDLGAKVINLSAGGSNDSAALQAAIDYAIAHGTIFITITHNDGTNVVRFPGRLPQCITVGGTERDDTLASFSNYGSSVDLVAPARDIYTVGMNGGLQYWYGTSFAAPQVAAVAAIIAGMNPAINQAGMEQILCAAAEDQVGGAAQDTPGWDQYFGYGRLNAKFALQLAGLQGSVPAVNSTAANLQWSGLPANAAQKQPLQVQYSNDLSGWTNAGTRSGVSYVGSAATWTDDGTQTGGTPGQAGQRFYRVLIQR